MSVLSTSSRSSRPVRPHRRGQVGPAALGWVRDRVRATLRSDASASARVEFAVAVCVAALRLGVVVQMLPALGAGVAASPRPGLYAAGWAAAAAIVLAVSAGSLLHRGPLGPRLMVADVALTLGFFALARATVPTVHLLGSWIGWAPGYALAVVMTLGAMRSSRDWLACVLAVMIGYAGYVRAVITGPAWPTIVGNLLGYLVLAATLRLIIAFVRRIAGEADAARAEVARLARREEEHRAQLAFHDATTVMQLLADPTLPAELRAQLQTQAVNEVRRMRTYLRGEAELAPGVPTDLAAIVASAAEGFGDLRPQATLDLVRGVRLPPAAAGALADALRTILHNVRRHAAAGTVLVHGDVEDEIVVVRADEVRADEVRAEVRADGVRAGEIGAGALPGVAGGSRWTLVVRDDGCGFDPATTAYGVGLRTQVVGELARHGITAAIRSWPGRGTEVELFGRCGR